MDDKKDFYQMLGLQVVHQASFTPFTPLPSPSAPCPSEPPIPAPTLHICVPTGARGRLTAPSIVTVIHAELCVCV